MKNPVAEYFRSQNAESIEFRTDGNGRVLVRPFQYLSLTAQPQPNPEDYLETGPFLHPDIDIFCDANVFAAPRLRFASALLRRKRVFVVPEVAYELLDFRERPPRIPGTKELLNLLFDKSTFHPAIEVFNPDNFGRYRNVVEYYVNLLQLRKRPLEPLVADFVERHGRNPVGRERTEMYRRLSLSPRAIRLANKGDPKRRYGDEATVVMAVLHSLLSGRDTLVLSYDADVFDQFYKLTSLLESDYFSYRLASDYLRNPQRYGAKYSLAEYADLDPILEDKQSSFVVERPKDINYLIPYPPTTRGIYVVAPEAGGSLLSWVGIGEMRNLLAIKSSTFGRNTIDHGDLNTYIALKPCIQKFQLPRKTYAFFLKDRTLKAYAGKPGAATLMPTRITLADYIRAIADVEGPKKRKKS